MVVINNAYAIRKATHRVKTIRFRNERKSFAEKFRDPNRTDIAAGVRRNKWVVGTYLLLSVVLGNRS